ncbi:YybH family protein [Nonomuraea turcica]|uniref:YybH family protein n=1 Tax=Nonomuraea sp. G32 TaxID=3067274 RepID=UPI00273CED48|nr:SgcJ/EcaC family oxidoreductase [Nonomuraea sp. G32]MDP4506131.1 SgcJ/EcaC family oxidoreductase [Nonomuraea sp. G32]
MTGDEERIRELIERWAEAVHAGDLERVLNDHADDIVMYDVPPPYEGVHGIEAYKETWPGFFQWQAQGASFEMETLDVTAGSDVAFAHALLRCGTPGELAANPDYRLRLTLGLRKEDGRWVVAHEHHSFPLGDERAAEEEVRQVHERWYAGTAAKDLDGMMTAIDDDVVSYEHEAPLEYVGVDEVRKVCARGLDVPGDVSFDVPDLKILVREDLAVAWGLNRVRVAGEDGQVSEIWSRGTRVFERRDGAWMMTHQHLSFPLDQATGAVRTDLRPSPPR